MTTKVQIVIDCVDPHAQATFWAAALGYEMDIDEEFIRRMLDQGHATEDDVATFEGVLVWKTGAACNDPGGTRPRLYFQAVPEPKTVKDRIHIDLHLAEHDDRAAEIARLERLGATVLYEGRQGPQSWTTMADPEGNEFCVS